MFFCKMLFIYLNCRVKMASRKKKELKKRRRLLIETWILYSKFLPDIMRQIRMWIHWLDIMRYLNDSDPLFQKRVENRLKQMKELAKKRGTFTWNDDDYTFESSIRKKDRLYRELRELFLELEAFTYSKNEAYEFYQDYYKAKVKDKVDAIEEMEWLIILTKQRIENRLQLEKKLAVPSKEVREEIKVMKEMLKDLIELKQAVWEIEPPTQKIEVTERVNEEIYKKLEEKVKELESKVWKDWKEIMEELTGVSWL